VGREAPDYIMNAKPAADLPPALAQQVSAACASLTHNLNGQRLGRKGRLTRERIITAALELLEEDGTEPFTLSAVAQRASLGLTSHYNYFTDLTELVLGVMEPVQKTAEEAYVHTLRIYWPDDELTARCYAFVRAFYDFWNAHTRLLHLRNSIADQYDARMVQQRIHSTQPIIFLLAEQMERLEDVRVPSTAMAGFVMTGIERSITMATDERMRALFGAPSGFDPDRYLVPAARLLELAIRDRRQATVN